VAKMNNVEAAFFMDFSSFSYMTSRALRPVFT
jgi:hypothetical protein